ncbi:hypothetical protein EGT07_08285 [Herbaspirillum sp. HC18]|nr:hypothetical protein EGT07_08285 [Herbaspirillum sp. HC18]
MQTMTYYMDNLKATAEIQETDVGGGRILAVISILENDGSPSHQSHHTIVFEPDTGKNIVEATKTVVRNLMHKHHLRKPAA